MKKSVLFVLILFLVFAQPLFAGNGDTLVIQAFTWSSQGSPKDGKFVFPPDTMRFEKILMYYSLKCDPNQSPACGEWDYLTYTYLYQPTGAMDSTLYNHSNFTINGSTPDSAMLMNSPSWNYFPHFQYHIDYTDTIALNNYTFGSGVQNILFPFSGGNPDSRTQFMWRKIELTASGMTAGAITGMKFYVNNLGGLIKNMTVKIKTSAPDSLTPNPPVTDAFTVVYSQNTTFNATGWNNINFTTPFQWDGNSNLIVDISFTESNTPCTVAADSTSWISCIHAREPDYFLNFDGSDYVTVSEEVFTDIDTSVTISFWQYGDPVIQPSNDVIFEGIDSAGNRVINVHLPWGDGKVYWDAGNTGATYDRVSKSTTGPAQYEGKWNHWAFTKNAQTGLMRMYLNGTLVLNGSGKTKLMKGIRQFKIGAAGNGLWGYYHGWIDDFCIWDYALDANNIKAAMYKAIDNSHPYYSHLKAYYKFNEGAGMQTANTVSANTAELVGFPQWKNYEGLRIKNFSRSHLRPEVKFETGSFVSQLDSTLVIDSTQKAPLMLVLFSDTIHPNIATDTLYKWPAYYTYTFDQNGHAIDSSLVPYDTVLHKVLREYYGEPFEVTNRFELGRYITPYGNGLDLGAGWTWIYDITDFRPLLKDTVHITAGNWQELLDLKFLMIKGVPPRDVIKIENVWQGDFALNNFASLVPPKSLNLDPNASMFKLKTTVTGHQFDNATNCAEFCYKIHSLNVDGILRYSWQIIQECSKNPLYPQGGTWIYARAGWCPGMPAKTQNLELTPYISENQVTLDYNAQYDNYGNYVTESQLVSYTSPNFTNDAALDDILSPNRYEIYGRANPICGRPVIRIKNTGSNPLNSLDIAYKFAGDTFYHYHWTGVLNFLQTADVALPSMDWNSPFAANKIFEATLSNPNGLADQYAYNNTMRSRFELSPIYNQPVVVNFKTNSFANENYYKVYDANGNIVVSKSGFANNTNYNDTLDLTPGCYEFVMTDTDEDGISWWANSDGAGTLKIKLLDGTVVKTFNPDFGSETRFQFSISEPTGVNYFGDAAGTLTIYPNPSEGKFTLDFINIEIKNAEICIYNLMGEAVYLKRFNDITGEKIYLNLSHLKKGIYLVKTTAESKRWQHKIVID